MGPREIVGQMDQKYALFGFLFAFNNRLQAVGDRFYEEITCKQFFVLACMNLFPDKNPSLLELAQVMGCSHQNVKNIVVKLKDKGFLDLYVDCKDKRKQRIQLTQKALDFGEKYMKKEIDFMNQLFFGIDEKDISKTFETLSKMESNLIDFNKKITNGGLENENSGNLQF